MTDWLGLCGSRKPVVFFVRPNSFRSASNDLAAFRNPFLSPSGFMLVLCGCSEQEQSNQTNK